ncbi:hypothetical protein HK101_001035 [Irineochytrium annulatum]|nr:hypothetical protein HK101_001035 [Irineochytrium annulatum]
MEDHGQGVVHTGRSPKEFLLAHTADGRARGAYTVMRCSGRRILDFDLHCKRLADSLGEMSFESDPPPFNALKMECFALNSRPPSRQPLDDEPERARELLAACRDHKALRSILMDPVRRLLAHFERQNQRLTKITVLITCLEGERRVYCHCDVLAIASAGESAVVVGGMPRFSPRAKDTMWITDRMELERTMRVFQADEMLLVDPHGCVYEGLRRLLHCLPRW